ncbi:hypothetical protein TeGR_g5846, partial [Tetraparma gracilis]
MSLLPLILVLLLAPVTSTSASFFHPHTSGWGHRRLRTFRSDPSDEDQCECYEKSMYREGVGNGQHSVEFTYIGFDGTSASSVLILPGEKTKVRVVGRVHDDDSECEGCVTQVYISGEGLGSTCLGSSNTGFGFSREFTYTAPATPGKYGLFLDWTWEYSCVLPEHVIAGTARSFADVYVWEPNTYSGVSMEEELEKLSRNCAFKYNEASGTYGTPPGSIVNDNGEPVCRLRLCDSGEYLRPSAWQDYIWFIFLLVAILLGVLFCTSRKRGGYDLFHTMSTGATNRTLDALRFLVLVECLANVVVALWWVWWSDTVCTQESVAGTNITVCLLSLSFLSGACCCYVRCKAQGRWDHGPMRSSVQSDSIRDYSRPLELLGAGEECSICMETFLDSDVVDGK